MDRRQKKTRAAIFEAFTELLSKKQYGKITIQEIIDEADVGRSTFYAHFETKDDLLQVYCKELFEHILVAAHCRSESKGRYSNEKAPESPFCHILHHLDKNDHNILNLLSCENSDIFLRYFREQLNELIREYVMNSEILEKISVPSEFMVNHISGSFVMMIQWWCQNGRKQTPEELDTYFKKVIPIKCIV